MILKELTREERFDTIKASLEASKRGDHIEAIRIMQDRFSLDPCIALAFKEAFGRDFIVRSGWDLSEAEDRYGTDWLDMDDTILQRP